MVVKSHMTAKVITIRPDSSLWKAWDLMQTHQIRHLPVTQGKQVVGMLTDRTLRQLMPSSLSPPDELDRFRAWGGHVKVSEVMSRKVFPVTPDTPVYDALKIILEQRVGCTPVVKGSTLVGILTTRDLLRSMAGILHAVGLDVANQAVRRAKSRQSRKIRPVKVKAGAR